MFGAVQSCLLSTVWAVLFSENTESDCPFFALISGFWKKGGGTEVVYVKDPAQGKKKEGKEEDKP